MHLENCRAELLAELQTMENATGDQGRTQTQPAAAMALQNCEMFSAQRAPTIGQQEDQNGDQKLWNHPSRCGTHLALALLRLSVSIRLEQFQIWQQTEEKLAEPQLQASALPSTGFGFFALP